MFDQITVNGTIQIDFDGGEIHHLGSGRVYRIGTNESELLQYLCLHPQQTLSRAQLIEKVWSSKGIVVEDGSLMQTISLCRKALEDNDGRIIVTERGQGYRFSGDTQVNETGSKNSVPIQKIESPFSLKFVSGLIATFVVGALGSYMVFAAKKPSLDNSVSISNYTSCSIVTDELGYSSLANVTLYRYLDKQVAIDDKGRSLTFPVESKEVVCE